MAVRRRRAAAALLLAAVIAAALALVLLPGGEERRPAPFAGSGDGVVDPFAYSDDRRADLERRAAIGLSHPLYSRSPGGVERTARRVVRYRGLVESVARAERLDPDMLEALVFLESAGRPDARASDDLDGAAGLTQILAETAQNLLGLKVDVRKSEKLTRGILRGRRVEARKRERRRVDERFDPPKAIAAAGRYLALARATLGRDDLAFQSYHMGIGNLQTTLRDYGEQRIPYAQLFFDSTPLRHPEAYRRLASFGDDSSTYLWRLLAAREIVRLFRTDLARLREIAELQTAKNSAEEALHPQGSTETFADPEALAKAHADGTVTPLSAGKLAQAGIAVDGRVGELARDLGVEPGLYRALRPKALATLELIGRAVQEISGGKPLRLTSTVRDGRYQQRLGEENGEATRNYSLHTTGYAFDIARDYADRAQALAFQFVLDRLTALGEIAWVREPGAIHVTVAGS